MAMPNGNWEYRFPWLDFPTGIAGFEVIRGTGAFNITNIAPGIDDPGPDVIYDGSGHDIAITSVTFEAVPEPSTWLLLGSGLVGLVLWKKRRRRRLEASLSSWREEPPAPLCPCS
jgi:hypothetical protein